MQKKKKVIISTYSNQLAREVYNAFVKHNTSNDLKIGIVIGKNNYLDIKKIDDEFYDFFYEPDCVKDFIIKKLKIENILFDDLFDECNIVEDNEKIVRENYCLDNRKELESFDYYDISITNHVFLLRNKNLKDYYILLDEVDRIFDAAVIVLTNSFSILRFKNLIKSAIKETKDDKKIKALNKIYKMSAKFLNDNLNEKYVKTYYSATSPIFKRFIENLADFYKKNKKYDDIIKSSKNKSLISEYAELKQILKEDIEGIDATIYFSPKKGYPSVCYAKAKITGFLHNFFQGLNGCFGTSATIFPTFKRDNDTISYLFNKIGINKDMEPRRKFFFGKRIFPVENTNIYIYKNMIALKSDDDGIPNESWVSSISEEIKKTFDNKNSLVLVGGYAEADAIYDILSKLLPQTNIIKANKNMTVKSIVNKFKKEGGILIGTRNYAVGIDLPGKELEKLYITKLLFPVQNSKYIFDLKSFNRTYAYFRCVDEMYITLRQACGRLIRSKTDSGDIYMFDNRILDKKYQSGFEILEYLGKITIIQ